MESIPKDFMGSLDVLAGWLAAGTGPRGFVFEQKEAPGDLNLPSFEARWGPLSPDHKRLLEQLGACLLFAGGPARRAGVEILAPLDIEDRFADFVEPAELLLERFVPVAIDRDTESVFFTDRGGLLRHVHDSQGCADWDGLVGSGEDLTEWFTSLAHHKLHQDPPRPEPPGPDSRSWRMPLKAEDLSQVQEISQLVEFVRAARWFRRATECPNDGVALVDPVGMQTGTLADGRRFTLLPDRPDAPDPIHGTRFHESVKAHATPRESGHLSSLPAIAAARLKRVLRDRRFRTDAGNHWWFAKGAATYATVAAATETIAGRCDFWCVVLLAFAAGFWPIGFTTPSGSRPPQLVYAAW